MAFAVIFKTVRFSAIAAFSLLTLLQTILNVTTKNLLIYQLKVFHFVLSKSAVGVILASSAIAVLASLASS